MGWRGLWLAAATLLFVVLSPFHEHAGAQTAATPAILISEYRHRGPNGTNDEFIELFNAGLADVDVSNWLVRASNSTGQVGLTTLPAGTRIRRGCFYLIVNGSNAAGVGVTPDRTYLNANGTPDNGGVGILTSAGVVVDQVGNNGLGSFGEGTRLPAFPATNTNQSYERLSSDVAGFVDTNDNAADFRLISPSTPRNSAVANCLTPVNLTVSGSAGPANVEQGQRVQLFASVTPATLPGSTNVQVTANLSALGGSPAAQFADNGVAPDAVANDNVFSYEHLVPQGNPLGARSVTMTAVDQQARRADHAFSVNVTLPASLYTPHEIQGAGATSPLPAGEPVMVRGVVTAKKADGFFLQTEAGAEDPDANTSEALFVPATETELSAAVVGHLVYVKGVVAELVPAFDPASPSITAVGDLSFIFDLGQSALPMPIELTSAEVSDTGTLDQLERFENMRVRASLTAVSGTGGDGAFYAVVTGQARPFREPGIESGYPVLPCAVEPCDVPLFDGNPERLRVDSDGQSGVAAVAVSTGATMDVTGPLHFESRTFTIVPDAPAVVAGGMSVLAVPAPAADQFTVASFFLGGAVNADRLAKASIAIRHGLHMPDIVAMQQVDDLAALNALAQAIDAGAAADGQAAPNYAAHFLAGSDAGVGVLVKQANARVTVNSFEAAGTNAVMLRAVVTGPSTSLPQAVTVIVPHFLSRDGSEAGDDSGALVREQRKAQAEALALFIQSRQSDNPAEAIVAIGDYNAFAFNDGYVDVVGTVRFNPAIGHQVATATVDLDSPELVNLGDQMPNDQRYSSVSNGNAQALDHALATANLASQFAGAARARINADFPSALSGDASSPSGLSDRDPMVVYFNFPADVTAPVLSGVPGDLTVEATSADGAAVTFAPTATDNLDGDVAVTCEPASGSTFALGNTGVTCSAQDAAGNSSSAAFTVSVVDTTAPVLTVPSDMIVEATSGAGAMVMFGVAAADAVTPALSVSCNPTSGSVFALGVTAVQCSVQDAAGNASTASFVVTVLDTTAPVLVVPGHISGEATSSDGRVVTFTSTAVDAVSGSLTVDCTPASGSTFAVGETVVTCAAADMAGNVATGIFTVTVTSVATAPVFGHMAGVGAVLEGDKRVWFAFDVKESANVERGWVMVQVRPAPGKPDRYLSAVVTGVQMSDSPDYTPPRSRTGVDTVLFSGIGYWNGASGYRYEISAADRGEPGRGRDLFSVKIYSPSDVLVESVTGVLRDGNIKSLR